MGGLLLVPRGPRNGQGLGWGMFGAFWKDRLGSEEGHRRSHAGRHPYLAAGRVSQRDHGWQMRLALEQQLCRCGGIRTSGSPRLRGCSAASGSSGLLPHPPLYPWDGTWSGGPARVGRSSQGQEPACGLGWRNTSRPRKLKESPFKSAPPWALPPGRASPPPPGGQVVSGDGHRGTLR